MNRIEGVPAEKMVLLTSIQLKVRPLRLRKVSGLQPNDSVGIRVDESDFEASWKELS